MYLRNFERIAGSAVPNANATVTIYVATLDGTHGAPVTFTDHRGISGTSTTVDANGMWEARDLTDGQYYDIRIEANGRVKWYSGRTMHQVERLYDDSTPDPSRNLIPNGGMNGWASWIRRGSAPITGIGVTPIEVADLWFAMATSGDSCTGTRGVPPSGLGAQYVSRLVYARGGGNLSYRETIDASIAASCRNKTLSVSFQVQQATNARLRVFIQDDAGKTSGAVTTSTGLPVTISAQRLIGATTTSLIIGIETDTPAAGTYTLDIGNAIGDTTLSTPVYAPLAVDFGLPVTTLDRFHGVRTADQTIAASTGQAGYISEFLSWYARRFKEILGTTNWWDPPGNTLSNAVQRTGDQMTGDLWIRRASTPHEGYLIFGDDSAYFLGRGPDGVFYFQGASLRLQSGGLTAVGNIAANGQIIGLSGAQFANDVNIYRSTDPGSGYIVFGNASNNFLGWNGSQIVTHLGKLWAEGNDGPTSGLYAEFARDASTLQGNGPAAFAVAAHTHGGGGAVGPHNHSGDVLVPGQITATGQISTTVTGVPPMTVTSSVRVDFMNVDMVDGAHASVTPQPGFIPIAGPGGQLDSGWIPGGGGGGGGTVPSGLIALYNGAAPTGWVIESNLAGRTAFGAGGGLTLAAFGGSVNHNHTFDHAHAARSGGGTGPVDRVQIGGVVDPNHVKDSHGHDITVDSIGGGPTTAVRDNMPPYWVLNYVRKT